MRIATRVREAKIIIARQRAKKRIIGLVPTMGALHAGHLSLVKIARQKSDFVVVSVFVNPKQFGPAEDFGRYPRDFSRDRKMLAPAGADLIFYPAVSEMYPGGYRTYVEVTEMGGLLCGRTRPGHFRGVCTVVLKLFNIIEPDIAVFGKKDYQQLVVIRQMVRDLNLDVDVVGAPVVREEDGLAMSSRNAYLSAGERKRATSIYRALGHAVRRFRAGVRDRQKVIMEIRRILVQSRARIDYVEAVDPVALTTVARLKKGTVIAVAGWFGKTRLIDNREL